MTYTLNMDWSEFLAKFWQKKPTVIRQGFVHFEDPISADELAGLALEEEVDSRLVTFFDNEWEAEHGPFTHFSHLEDENWSLLVQSVDHWHEDAAELVKPFKVLPDWRFDDLMVSFSAPNGGVGPHIDQYGVFIIQGSGKRRWRVGDINVAHTEVCPHPSLLHVNDFDAIIDTELLPGDILYIPPGFPHDGVSLEASMSFSVGYRAPNTQDLFSNFADYLLENELGLAYYNDTDLPLRQNPSEILPTERQKIKSMMMDLLQDEHLFTQWFGQFISQSRHELTIIPADPPFKPDNLVHCLKSGAPLQRSGGLRVLILDKQGFANGEKMEMATEPALILSRSLQVNAQDLFPFLDDKQFIKTLTELINRGYWYFVE